jgi:hypothetical protein
MLSNFEQSVLKPSDFFMTIIMRSKLHVLLKNLAVRMLEETENLLVGLRDFDVNNDLYQLLS